MSSADSPSSSPDTARNADNEALLSHPRIHRSLGDEQGRAWRRIVSLVPSLSEALVVLGLGDRLVGVTEYCVHPSGAFSALPKVGGTKDAEVDAIIALAPDLVIANHEENTPRVIRRLVESEIDVWLTYPRTVREGAMLLRELAGLGADDSAFLRCVVPVESALAEAAERRADQASVPRPKVFCPIWRDPWMTIGRDTYIHDLIDLCGGENLFADAAIDSQGDTSATDRRYPIVDLEQVAQRAPDVILLPDEPYAFDETDRRRLSRLDCPAARDGRIHLIDGTLVSWYGPRIAEAIRALATIFANS